MSKRIDSDGLFNAVDLALEKARSPRFVSSWYDTGDCVHVMSAIQRPDRRSTDDNRLTMSSRHDGHMTCVHMYYR